MGSLSLYSGSLARQYSVSKSAQHVGDSSIQIFFGRGGLGAPAARGGASQQMSSFLRDSEGVAISESLELLLHNHFVSQSSCRKSLLF